jgi:hypothetical protein
VAWRPPPRVSPRGRTRPSEGRALCDRHTQNGVRLGFLLLEITPRKRGLSPPVDPMRELLGWAGLAPGNRHHRECFSVVCLLRGRARCW